MPPTPKHKKVMSIPVLTEIEINDIDIQLSLLEALPMIHKLPSPQEIRKIRVFK